MPNNQDNGGGGAKLPFRAMQKVVSEVGGRGCSRRGPKNGNFTASIEVWIHYNTLYIYWHSRRRQMLNHVSDLVATDPGSSGADCQEWPSRTLVPPGVISPSPQTWRLSDSFISYLFSLTGKSGESLVNMWMFLCCGKCAAAAGHQPPMEKKNLIFCYKDSTTQVSVFAMKQLPPDRSRTCRFSLFGSVEVTGLSCGGFSVLCSALLIHTKPSSL